jgi:hypothetical protein
MSRTRRQPAWHGGRTDETLTKAEGLLSKLRDTPPERRPEVLTASYLAKHYGCSVQRMRARIADAEAKQSKEDEADLWLEVIYQIGNELGETLCAKTFAIARDTSNRNALTAQKFLLPKIDPATFGDDAEARTATEPRALISDIPQEVFDELTAEEAQELESQEQVVLQSLAVVEQLVRRVQKRIADRRAEES